MHQCAVFQPVLQINCPTIKINKLQCTMPHGLARDRTQAMFIVSSLILQWQAIHSFNLLFMPDFTAYSNHLHLLQQKFAPTFVLQQTMSDISSSQVKITVVYFWMKSIILM